ADGTETATAAPPAGPRSAGPRSAAAERRQPVAVERRGGAARARHAAADDEAAGRGAPGLARRPRAPGEARPQAERPAPEAGEGLVSMRTWSRRGASLGISLLLACA